MAPVNGADESRKLQAFPVVLATVVVHGGTPVGGLVIVAEAPWLAIDVSVYAAVLQSLLRSSTAAF